MSSILSEDRRARRRGNANAISNASGSDANQMHESSEEDEEMSEDDEFLDANESPTSENDDEWSDVESGDENPKEPSPVDLETRQQELRQRIFAIQADTNLSSAEKSQQIQQLMSNKCQQLNKNPKSPKNGQAADLQPGEAGEEDKTVLWHDKDENIMGCKHYRRDAKLQAYCCNKWVGCRFCHDEVADHAMNRHDTNYMMCMHCFAVQSPAQSCERCKRRLGSYFCGVCKLWDSDNRKAIYHCNDCGICRIGHGLGEDFFHCQTCNVCMAISLQGSHKCIERNLESDCPICGEFMFTSTTTVIFMPCGHCIHYKCHEEYIQTSYQCPTCFKSLANMTEYFSRIDNMLAQHTMPSEYEKWVSWILCNDCEKKSFAKYHFLYHKCADCGSYNTKTIKTMDSMPAQTPE